MSENKKNIKSFFILIFKKYRDLPPNTQKIIFFSTFFLLITLLIFLLVFPSNLTYESGVNAVMENYGKKVKKYAKVYNLPASYLMALIMIESGGRKKIHPRYEPHIYKKLKALKNNKIKRFENLTPNDVKNLSDRQLKKLAKSYGPFQIMGYKTIKMGITVDELEGKNAIKYGVKWINDNYGDYLRQGKFKDAFHIHNTGRPYPSSGKPTTHNPNYVKNGLAFMSFFSKKM